MARRPATLGTAARPAFNAQEFLDSERVPRTVIPFAVGAVIFKQGDPSDHVMYIQSGGVKLSVLSKAGREAVVAMLGPGDFFGEGCLADQPLRMGTASAITPSSILKRGSRRVEFVALKCALGVLRQVSERSR